MADTEDYAETLRSMSFSSLLDERDWAKAGDSDCRRRKRRAVNAELDARWERIAASATPSPQPAPSVERCEECGGRCTAPGMLWPCETCHGTGRTEAPRVDVVCAECDECGNYMRRWHEAMDDGDVCACNGTGRTEAAKGGE